MQIDLKYLEQSCHTNALSKGTIFYLKMLNFCKKNADFSKIKGVLTL